MNSKLFKITTVFFLSAFFLGLGATSIGHVVTFWEISNSNFYSLLLAVGNAFGIISSILLTFYTKEYHLGVVSKLILGLTAVIELFGNIYYHYVTIDPQSDSFKNWIALFNPIFNNFNIGADFESKMRSYTAIVEGAWLPLTHILVFFAISRILANWNNTPYTEEKNEEVDSSEPNKEIETINEDNAGIELDQDFDYELDEDIEDIEDVEEVDGLFTEEKKEEPEPEKKK
jgi:hypothetical protein